jgi:hypothetical protein
MIDVVMGFPTISPRGFQLRAIDMHHLARSILIAACVCVFASPMVRAQGIPSKNVSLEELPIKVVGRLTGDGDLVTGDGGIEVLVDGPTPPIKPGVEYEYTIHASVRESNAWGTSRVDPVGTTEYLVEPEKIFGDGISTYTLLFDQEKISIGDIEARIEGKSTREFVGEIWNEVNNIKRIADLGLAVGSGGLAAVAKLALEEAAAKAFEYFAFDREVESPTFNIGIDEPKDLQSNSEISRLSIFMGGEDDSFKSWWNDLRSATKIELTIPVTFREAGTNSIVLIPDLRGDATTGSGRNEITGSVAQLPSLAFEYRQAFSITSSVSSMSNLSRGGVDPIIGDTESSFDFNIVYSSETGTPPDGERVNLVVDGTTYPIQSDGTDWASGVTFSKTIPDFDAGTHEYYFKTTTNGRERRYPESGVRSFEVRTSCKGRDLSVTDASFNGARRGNPVVVEATVKNRGTKTFNSATVKAELKGPGGSLDSASESILGLQPKEEKATNLTLEVPSDAPDGTYQVVVSSSSLCDANFANNSLSRSFVLGEELPQSLYAVSEGKKTIRTEGKTFSVGGLQFEVTDIRNGEVQITRQRDGDENTISDGQINIWDEDNVAIAVDDALDRRGYTHVDIWAGSAVWSGGPKFEQYSVAGHPGQEISFEADIPSSSSATFRADSRESDVFLNSDNNPIKSWFEDTKRNNDRYAEFIFEVPSNANRDDYTFYLNTYHDGNTPAYLTRLQLQVTSPPPEITKISSNTIAADDQITISGRNFGSGGSVEFDDLQASDIQSWSNTSIQVTVPEGVEPGNLTVITNAGASRGLSYQLVNSPGDPSTGDPGIALKLPDQSMSAGEDLLVGDLKDYFGDPNGDALDFSVSIDGADLTHDPNSLSQGSLRLEAASGASGDFEVVVEATDADEASVSQRFIVDVKGTSPLNTLSVTSTNPGSGVSISVRPGDENGDSNGETPFSRSYLREAVTLTTPKTADGTPFYEWQRDDSTYSTVRSATLIIDGDHALTAVYKENYSVTGQVVDESGSPVINAGLFLTGDESGIAVTDSTGSFSFERLVGETYTITPVKQGHTFEPVSREITRLGGDVSGQDFTKQDKACVDIEITSGWTLASIPVEAPDMSIDALFPDPEDILADSTYGYDASEGGYITAGAPGNDRPEFEVGKGYFFYNYGNDKTFEVCGQRPDSYETSIDKGWNIIGAPLTDVPISSLTSNPSPIYYPTSFFGWKDGGYTRAETLKPTKGYWLYGKESGTLQLSGAKSAAKYIATASPPSPKNWIRLIVTDADNYNRTLHLSSDPVQGTQHMLPPPLPREERNVRFKSNRSVGHLNKDGTDIQLQDLTYPITLEAHNLGDQKIKIQNAAKTESWVLQEGEPVTISNSVSQLTVSRQEDESKFKLHANYPNPFMQRTLIRFTLPEPTWVRISVFNALGQEVRQLANRKMEAGLRSVDFTANGLASGVYFYRVEAGSFTRTRKMVVLK